MVLPGRAFRKGKALVCFLLIFAAFFYQVEDLNDALDAATRTLSEGKRTNYEVKSYTNDDVIWTQRNFTAKNYHLVFDGRDGFWTYGEPKDYYKGRTVPTNYRLVKALLEHFPDRFAPGQPPFQMLFSTSDSPHTSCMARPRKCNADKFAPILQYGSVPKDPTLLPTVIPTILPTWCMQNCNFKQRFRTRPWESLKPQIIWRGSDFSFERHFGLQWKHNFDAHIPLARGTTRQGAIDALIQIWDKLTPRWIAVVFSLQASSGEDNDETLPWIDAKFLNRNGAAEFKAFEDAGASVSTSEYMGKPELAGYKYHIDLGGGGGTTWGGTLDKLALPGLLFHHETLTKDFFHDRLVPWEHYVPVEMDLSDLKERFDWAEAHPEEAQNISKAATEFILQMRAEANSGETYNDYFLHPLEEIVKAYKPGDDETFETISKQFEKDGILPLAKLGECDRKSCDWKDANTEWLKFS